MRIDIKKDRELLGLPPRKRAIPLSIKLFLGLFLVVGLSAILGLAAQKGRLLAEDVYYANLVYQLVQQGKEPRKIEALARQIRALGLETAQGKFETAQVLSYAANFLPERRLWQSDALNLFESAQALERESQEQADNPALDFYCAISISGLLFELGYQKQALEALAGIDEEKLSLESGISANTVTTQVDEERKLIPTEYDVYYNLKAYILSSATDPAVRNPALAMKLIDKVFRDDWQTGNYPPAYLDTLAECYYANNQPEKAYEIQRKALAGAASEQLTDYLQHFKKYAEAANASIAPLE